MKVKAWESFKSGEWQKDINVRDFIQKNYKPYEGDDKFLVKASEKTKKLWSKVRKLMAKELEKRGVLDADTKIVSSITVHEAGYIDKSLWKRKNYWRL